ncbi:glutathione biosynthesis bifunctional protein GshAB [Insulibacter thermoxylanivorax]|uniref:Glutathione biosynthesis bifunctional protein GshAB n=1 Tax=Insulibacter thermoxylanivorax TaxID=2749268 RepID=A0A916VH02_9BACL|nr:bifunctional glutamate--cysteine ligase GshA/glutathione synthetase GshB [Insulibacter thermoxylanivorax]GFR39259.1 glutathione biosynthesis bifunctional protein GshAB [Insulibacter thermoxylanivorax]
MMKLDRDLISLLLEHGLQEDLFQGNFGLEKEHIRVDAEGRIARTPHPAVFGNRLEHPYIRTDFAESQIELITPALPSIEEAYQFLGALHDLVALELKDEYLWPSSNPPILPADEEIHIAAMKDLVEDGYRQHLAARYGKRKQLLSGIHYNFSFREEFLKRLYEGSGETYSYQEFINNLYLRIARNTLKHRWLLIYLTGASPVFHKTYLERCVELNERISEDSYSFPKMNSLRNSVYGYRNHKPLYVSLESLEAYVQDLFALVKSGELIDVREYYSCVRLKTVRGHDLRSLLQEGVDYLELRMIDLNPLDKYGISLEMMQLIHLFLVSMMLLEDDSLDRNEQQLADLNHDSLVMNGIMGTWYGAEGEQAVLQDKALELLEGMDRLLQIIRPREEERLRRLLSQARLTVQQPEQSIAEVLRSQMQETPYADYHMELAKQYAEQSRSRSYNLSGYEDLELSTQLLLKAAIKRGISIDILDRRDNFVMLRKGDRIEYVKQATKTSLDSYSTVLMMENKVVTKKVLGRQGIRVPAGQEYRSIDEAAADYGKYRGRPIVIKPKSTNFGIGITIFKDEYSADDYRKALELAFEYDASVLLEEYIAGKEYRFLVMGGEVVGVLHRVPANVTGDGKHTIAELIDQKNRDPRRGTGHRTPLERIQLGEVERMFLQQQGRTPEDVPAAGEVVYLRENSNISTGGDSIDYTDEMPSSYKEIAVRAVEAVGAVFCGVDMIIEDIAKDANERNYCIIELNFNPAIHMHCYPYKGKNRRAEERILDLLFG